MNLGKSYKESVQEYARGIIGGLLFSFPLLYTMEVWWAGYTTEYIYLLLLMLFTYVVLLGYNRYAGMHPSVKWKNIFMESIEEMGIGITLSFLVLYMLNRLNLDNGFHDVVGKVVIEAMLVSIGVSVGTAQMGSSANDENEKDNSNNDGARQKENKSSSVGKVESVRHSEGKKTDRRSGKLAMVILAICGSLLVASTVAPTDEIVMLAAQCNPYQILAIALVSILLSMLTGYFSNFKGTERKEMKLNSKDILYVTFLCYISALFISGFLLWFFGRFQNLSVHAIVNQIIVLGLIASMGGSAGRLLIK